MSEVKTKINDLKELFIFVCLFLVFIGLDFLISAFCIDFKIKQLNRGEDE